MASIKYKDIENELKKLKQETLPSEIGYILLKSFGTSDTYIKRYKSGKGNLATFDGLLIKKSLAYKPVATLLLTDELEAIKQDEKVDKQKPRIIAVSDGETLLAYDTKEKESYENKVEKIWLDFQFFYPLAGVEKFSFAEESDADVKAAVKMAKLHNEIRRYNEFSSEADVHDLNIFMTRLLFCFFAEDTGIFQKGIFSNYIQQCTQDDGSDLSESLDTIFNVMDQTSRLHLPNVVAQFPYVNGGLFHQRITIPQMGYKVRKVILECGELNWGEINPDIFGSMIQGVVTPELRGDFGMHYTSVPNILKLIQPLFLNNLEEEFAKAWDSEKKLNALLIRISKIKFFDPACGSGNFLVITYKELRNLEIRIWKRIAELTGSHALPFTNISISQFYGIEIDSFAHEVAMLSLWLAEHQMNALFTKAFANVHIQALPLKNIDTIREGNACRVDWNEVCPHTADEEVYVFGNPPYLGSSMQNVDQKSDLQYVCGHFQNYKNLDYIACWFYKGAIFIKKTNSKYAFVSTNSICQGDSVALLWPYIFRENLEINFAHQSFKWTNNAQGQAAVIVVIIGIAKTSTSLKKLFNDNRQKECKNINAYLLDAPNIIIGRLGKSISNLPEIVFGNKPTDGGFLILDRSERNELLNKYPEAKDIIKAYQGADSYINGEYRYCLWISDENLQLARSIPEIDFRLQKVSEFRLNSTADSTVLYADRPHMFKQRAHKDSLSIIIPRVSSEKRKYIPIGFLDDKTVISDAAQAIYNANIFILGLISSRIHVIWVEAIGGKLKSDYRYSSLCYNSFPFPPISLNKKKILEALAEEVLLTRENHSEKTLAEMYDPDKMPADLRAAHHALDLAVDGCYQSTPFNNDEERLECLFKLYEKMTK